MFVSSLHPPGGIGQHDAKSSPSGIAIRESFIEETRESLIYFPRGARANEVGAEN